MINDSRKKCFPTIESTRLKQTEIPIPSGLQETITTQFSSSICWISCTELLNGSKPVLKT